MRIKSDFKDYYDKLLSYDNDNETTFNRFTKQQDFSFNNNEIFELITPFSSQNFVIFTHLIGFCGKVYPIYEFFYEPHNINSRRYRVIYTDWSYPLPDTSFAVDFEHINKMIEATISAKAYQAFSNPLTDRPWYVRRMFQEDSLKSLEARIEKEIPEKINKCQNDFNRIFEETKSPIFIITPSSFYNKGPSFTTAKITINPLLSDFNFAKIKDPYLAYQEMRVWFSNLAFPEPKMIQMSNDENIERLGFDTKYSFRKASTKKRR